MVIAINIIVWIVINLKIDYLVINSHFGFVCFCKIFVRRCYYDPLLHVVVRRHLVVGAGMKVVFDKVCVSRSLDWIYRHSTVNIGQKKTVCLH